MKTSVALAALLLVSSVSHADPQRVAPFQKKQAQTRDNGKPHPFNARDLVMLDRVGDPQLSPDGKRVAFQLRETDYAENKGVTSIWMLDLGARNADPVRLAPTFVASGARWSPDGKYIYFIGKPKSGQLTGVYRVDAADDKATPEALTPYRVDVNNFKLSPDGTKLLLSIDVEPACAATLCVDAKNPAPTKASGKLYDKLFVRHWDTWADGKRSQLFITDVNPTAAKASMVPRPKLLSKGIDGDVPSKPFGDETEYAFSPDGKTVYFDVRIAGRTEPWSTNFDIYSVPADASGAPQNLTASNPAWDAFPLPSADGKTLYYAAMKRPGFEADRFGIMALDLASGKSREVDPQWDRSAGGMVLSKNGKTIYATTDDDGDHALFAIDIASGKATRMSGPGQVEGFSVVGDQIIANISTLKTPADLFRLGARGKPPTQLTHFNEERLARAQMGDYEFFTFKGADDATVQGYVVKPVHFDPNKKYPVAFIIHGGPQGAMTNEFHYRWNPQTYAGEGFAVVTVNFHGSTGYGQAFTDSISKDWGDKPLDRFAERLGRRAGQVYFSRRQPRLRTRRVIRRLHDLLDGRQLAAAVEMSGRSRWRFRQPHDGVCHRRVVVLRMGERRNAVGSSGTVREVQPDRPRERLARADARHPQRERFPHSGRAGIGGVHGAAAQRYTE